MAAAYCYEIYGFTLWIPLRFMASLFYIQMRYLVYMRYLWPVLPRYVDFSKRGKTFEAQEINHGNSLV